MKKTYSRLESVEEKRNVKRAITFIVLTIAIGLFLLFVGIPLAARLATFISNLKSSSGPITQSDTTPPAPPKFDAIANATNQQSIKVTGTAEPGATVKLLLNGKEQNVIVENSGEFSINFALTLGTNSYSGIAVDAAGNTSQETKTYSIVFDNKEPEINIDSPNDGAQYYGAPERQLTIKGSTEAGASVNINDRIVTVDENGAFEYSLTLNEGENKFTIKSQDEAGNSTQKELTVSFTP